MKRTAMFGTLILNAGKWQEIHKIVRVFAQPRTKTLLLSSLVMQ